ncbi:ribonuclease M5 [Saliterribacillus persicus]|uniref:Ribonuclease M5 n=1 Tax=Saliterribacillus persicus TaxID=930114 RepID=A0A368X4X3_9BACI|nr:ribonuclease M5 [Saliterribacillus persicus]RCW63061.1 RNAse M5 [Saliterribacillus persicus]
MYIKEIIVVEGKDDTAKIKQALKADTVETNGSAINHSILEQIKHAKEKRGVIVFTDPDYPGQRIREIINEHVPGCKHAFLTKQEAKGKAKGSLGIEHASNEAIRKALSSVYELRDQQDEIKITRQDLMHYKLIGDKDAKKRREYLGKSLRIGSMNGKQLLKRLQMFQIDKETFIKVMEEMKQEDEV